MARKAWWQRYEVTGDIPSAVRRQTGECWAQHISAFLISSTLGIALLIVSESSLFC